MAESSSIYTVLQLVHMDETGDSYYRMRWPARDLAKQTGWRVINLDYSSEERFSWGLEADLLVLYQSNDPDLYPLIEQRRKAGKRTLVEYNDNFYSPPAPSPVREQWSSPLLWQAYERFMRQADGVLVTGEGLVRLFSEKIEPQKLHILKNHLPSPPEALETLWKERKELLEKNEIRIGWAGSLGHMADLLAIAPVLREVVQKDPRVKIFLMGNESIPEQVGLPEKSLVFKNWGTMDEYFEFLRQIHLGTAVQLGTPYNNCRSDIKAVEFASQGVMPILAESLPYHEFALETAVPQFKSLNELKIHLASLLREPSAIYEAVKRCHRYVSKERLGIDRRERQHLYEANLPSTPGQFKWPQEAGYHEISAKERFEGPGVRASAEALALAGKREWGKASEILSTAIAANPFSPDLGSQQLAMYRNGGAQAEFVRELERCLTKYPEDFRFILIFASVAEASQAVPVWRQLLLLLTKENDTYRKFYSKDVVRAFLKKVVTARALEDLIPDMLNLFPHSFELRFFAARMFERRGKSEDALKQFRWLEQVVALITENGLATPPVDPSFIKTWREAIEARLRG